MAKPTDITVKDATLYFLPTWGRMPLKFGKEKAIKTNTKPAICIRVQITVEDKNGNSAVGWGETPLGIQWMWPSDLTVEQREQILLELIKELAKNWQGFSKSGHPMEIGHEFTENTLKEILKNANSSRKPEEQIPWLAALVCNSAFDMALHDGYGVLHNIATYSTYNSEFMNEDLSFYLEPDSDCAVSFEGKYPQDFMVKNKRTKLPAWHLVGGVDPITKDELTGTEPDDEYPVLLRDWIRRDGLKCLKIKLRGNDSEWDYKRVVDIGNISIEEGVDWLTADFNCTVENPDYVNSILDKLRDEHPRIYGMILYVEQPFPYELEKNKIDVHSVSARKPLFMDESAHDWHIVRLGRSLGWSGVALKTCKTQTGAILSLCWAQAHGMGLMVQDLTNRMLSQIPHVLLASHADTIMGVETNGMQFFPDSSKLEEAVHPGIYRRRDGVLDLSTLGGYGFGYRVDDIARDINEFKQ